MRLFQPLTDPLQPAPTDRHHQPRTGQFRQHETRHQRSRQHPAERIETELRQTRKTGKEQGAKSDHRGHHTQADGGPEQAPPALHALVPGLDKVVDGVVHRLADQRGPEAHRHPEHRAVHQADHGHPHQRRAEHRDEPQRQQTQRPIDPEKHQPDGHRADQREALDLVLDGLARLHGKATRSRDRQLHRVCARGGTRARKRCLDACDGLGLPVGVGAERARLQQEHRPLTIPRRPDALAHLRLRRRIDLAEDGQQLTGGVSHEKGFERHPRWRGQQVDGVGHGRAQTFRAEPFGRDRRAECVTVAQQHIALGLKTLGLPVLHRDKGTFGRQLSAQGTGHIRALCLVATADGHHQQP